MLKENSAADLGQQVTERIEEKVLKLSSFKTLSEVPIFKDYIEKVASKIELARTSYSILEAFLNIDVTAEKLAACLKANPYYEYQFLQYIQSISKREDQPSLEAATVLLGMQNSRNLVVALQLMRTVKGVHPEWGGDGKLKLTPKDHLKYALKTEEALLGDKSGYSDTAYAAGLVFDFLAAVALDIMEDSKAVLAYIDQVYSHSLRAAQVGVKIAQVMPEFGFKKYLFSACLIHDVGKIIMAVLNPKYIQFTEEMSKNEVPRAIRYYTEKKFFGINHSVFSAMSCHDFRIFKILEDALLYHHEPYLLKSTNKNLSQLASMICLATNIANHFKKTDKTDDPVVSLWKGHELKGFNVDMKQVVSAVAKMS